MTNTTLTPRQRRQLGTALDCLTDAESHLHALIESEPNGTRDLLLVIYYIGRLLTILMMRFAEPVPPAPAAQAEQRGAA